MDKDINKVIKSYDFDDRYRIGITDNPYSLMLGLVGDISA